MTNYRIIVFLNIKNITQRLSKYISAFDVVLTVYKCFWWNEQHYMSTRKHQKQFHEQLGNKWNDFSQIYKHITNLAQKEKFTKKLIYSFKS